MPADDDLNKAAITGDDVSVESEPTLDVNVEDETPSGPEVPKKFLNDDGTVNTESLLKSYGELERRLGKGNASDDTSDETTTDSSDGTDDSSNDSSDNDEPIVVQASKAFWENGGELTDEWYTKLADKGYPKELVDEYIAGQKAIGAQSDNSAYELVGGQEAYDKMVEWASTNYDDSQVKAYNDAIDSGDAARRDLAIGALRAAYERANGVMPARRVGGSSPANAGVAPFESEAQVTAAMRDPRYREDPAFRAEVERRLVVSDVFGQPATT